MKNNLLADFEQVLNIEANRIFIELVNMYNNRAIVNKDFSELVGELMKDEFDYYFVE